jgi:hypothetical protein
MHLQWDFLLTGGSGGSGHVSTLGQDLARADKLAESAEQTSPSIPDFSGIWAHPYWPGFEPPGDGKAA